MKFSSLFLLFLLVANCQAETVVFTPRQADEIPNRIRTLKTGDRVVFQRGRYLLREEIRLTNLSDVKLETRGRVELVLSDLDAAVVSIENCKRIQVRGFRARHQSPAKEYRCEGAVIRVQRSSKVLIADNRLNGCGAAGVYAIESKDVVIYGNRIFNNTFAGVWLASSQATVHKNRIYDNAAALVTYGECEVALTENKIEDNKGNMFWASPYFDEAK